ncbi:hypothetical protein LTR53_016183 [Teratosphaeriaceae sp. CCFEE 6253]|nr:hypothetical protein LTR53_016183 [Teratosphaeriaceae sp. CCFEE 6253]
MSSPPSTTHPFDKIINLRDVGTFINDTTNQQLLKPGLFLRSARPDAASPRDRERLLTNYRLKTVIDLRTETEHIDARKKFTEQPSASAPAVAPADPKRPLRIPGITYEDVDLNGKPYSNALLKQLPWRQKGRLYSLYVLGYRKEAISILGENVMAKRGLAGLAEDSLEHCTAEVKVIFDVLSDAASYPVLVHCTQGKDRTGLTVLLVLMLLDVPLEAIERDYRLSERELEPEREDKLKEIRSIGLPDSFADCPADWVANVSGFVNDKYGGVEKYLDSCGVGKEQQEGVRKTLLA